MRIPPVEAKVSAVNKDTARTFDYFMKERGRVPRMFQVAAHRPEIMRTMVDHFRAVMDTGTLPAQLKELVITHTSQINQCTYCYEPHAEVAQRHGLSKDQLEGLRDFETRTDFTAKEKAALRLAEQMTRDSNGVGDEQWKDLRTHFDDGQIVELLAVIGLFNYFNRFNNVLGFE
jgi:uncharacterized peroxidase-related enzyme